METIIIIGAGAAGLFAASKLNPSNYRVVLLEQNKKVGKKILATGNGRANISNLDMRPEFYHNGERFADDLVSFDIKKQFEDLGMLLRYDNSLVYPYSNSSKTVVDTFLMNMENVEVILECRVDAIRRKERYELDTTKGMMKADIIIDATGSIAGGYNGLSAQLQQSLPVEYVDLEPALVMLKTSPVYKSIKGVRVKAKVSLLVNGRAVDWRLGEVLFNDTGLSGICIMQLSRQYLDYKNENVEISIDLLPQMSKAQQAELNEKYLLKYHEDYRKLIFNEKLAEMLKKEKVTNFKDLRFKVTGTLESTRAQVMRGGISLDSINDDFSLKAWPDYYVVGEALDIDGDCGGYNLHFAFTSANKVVQKIMEA